MNNVGATAAAAVAMAVLELAVAIELLQSLCRAALEFEATAEKAAAAAALLG
jgi:hypothetical protein